MHNLILNILTRKVWKDYYPNQDLLKASEMAKMLGINIHQRHPCIEASILEQLEAFCEAY